MCIRQPRKQIHRGPIRPRQSRFAFTLAELLIAIGILGVIATFSIPKILTAQQEAKKWAIFKEGVSAAQQAVWELVQNGEIQLRSHSCATDTSVDSAIFDSKINHISKNVSSGNRAYLLTNGSTLYVGTGAIIDLRIDYDGYAGPNIYGTDRVLFHLNDCDGTYQGVPPGRFGTITASPAGYVAENRALWEEIWEH